VFDVGFWELVLLFVLGLVVLGPEKLPRVANQLGRYAGQARRMASTLTSQIRTELEAEERRILAKESRAAEPAPAPAWSRPGVDELRAAPPPAEPVQPPEPADTRSHADAGADDPAPPFRHDQPPTDGAR
jgi:sec-independent protein translocase protein TatB